MDVILLATEAFIKQSCVERLLLKHLWAVILKKTKKQKTPKKREALCNAGFKMQNKQADKEQADKSLRAGCSQTPRAVFHRSSKAPMFKSHWSKVVFFFCL